ncbi:hypothetical protein JRO89_XS01G0386400 [Xanthoceras sorbifolium]|uniref:Light-harvesting complex-like protein 3 isotype 1, chloroplastic n=1 Tax=Xanthoceras sorbifolium TaxID=99658 RepID=A0ABQ8IPU4_9ROSI|nr:hypothetical protein JRO89_XS01G0386400 [Xanthoceras sorbifolium]
MWMAKEVVMYLKNKASLLHIGAPKDADDELKHGLNTESSVSKFIDDRWKNGTWDLNMLVKDGKMDWDGVIVAGEPNKFTKIHFSLSARRRKFLEMYPESATNEEPVLFRSSIIPWWAWLMRSYLPEAELINGRAAMVGFFMAYIVDLFTGLDLIGQTGNLICKAGVFVTVMGMILFRKKEDYQNLKNLADEATLYDKQWQSSGQQQNTSKDSGKDT